MHALFVVLNQVDYLDEILVNFVEAGVSGATILDSQGMAGAMADNQKTAPFLGLLKNFLDDSKPYNKTIFTVLESEELLEKIVALIKDILGEDAKKGAGFMFSVPIGKIYKFEDL